MPAMCHWKIQVKKEISKHPYLYPDPAPPKLIFTPKEEGVQNTSQEDSGCSFFSGDIVFT